MNQNLFLQKKQEFKHLYPDTFFLDLSAPDMVDQYLKQQNIIDQHDQIIRIEKAGQGNMNLTLRVVTNHHTLIVKQSRPWVEKYPSIPAPMHRTSIEGLFYKTITDIPELSNNMPKLVGLDEKSNIIFMEDLGQIESFDGMYRGTPIQEEHLSILLYWINILHQHEFSPEVRHLLKNFEMRKLNHEHIFSLPLNKNNGLDLENFTPGLSQVGNELKNNPSYCKKVEELGKLYLSEGKVLLHGDYYPGSWMQKENKVYVIDPEFCFFGPPEFDIGIVLAHLLLSDQPRPMHEKVFAYYQNNTALDKKLVYNFAGVEIMRRLIGVAQLPLHNELEKKEEMLMTSLEWVLL
jgi:5-methylthioribose kinase